MTSLIGLCMTWGVVGVTRFTHRLDAYYFFEAVDPIWTGVALALALTGLLTGAVGLYRRDVWCGLALVSGFWVLFGKIGDFIPVP